MDTFLRRLRAVLSVRRGSAAVEFAIVGPVLLLMATGMYDYGTALWQKIQVENAARAGAAFVPTSGFDAGLVTRAVSGATGLVGITATPPPTQFCGCAQASVGIVAASCGSPCARGDVASNYVTVSASAIYRFTTPMPARAATVTLRSTAVARVQ